jgi:hypothetical protein
MDRMVVHHIGEQRCIPISIARPDNADWITRQMGEDPWLWLSDCKLQGRTGYGSDDAVGLGHVMLPL